MHMTETMPCEKDVCCMSPSMEQNGGEMSSKEGNGKEDESRLRLGQWCQREEMSRHGMEHFQDSENIRMMS